MKKYGVIAEPDFLKIENKDFEWAFVAVASLFEFISENLICKIIDGTQTFESENDQIVA